MEFFPNGGDSESKGHIGLFLCLEERDWVDFNVTFSLGIKGVAEKDTYMKEVQGRKGSEFTNWGYGKIISFTTLFNPAGKYIANGNITLVCEVSLSLTEKCQQKFE